MKKIKLFLIMLVAMVVMGACDPTQELDAENVLNAANEMLDIAESLLGETKPGTVTGDTTLQAHFIDVGQGDAILVGCNNHYMLIDAGENEYGDDVVKYIESHGITKLDYVIGTHPHSDHIGGLDDVIESLDVEKVMLPEKTHTTKTYEDVLMAIQDKNLKITVPEVGEMYTLGNATFTILGPMKNYGDDLNNWSIGVKITYGEVDIVSCGDAEEDAELDMLLSDINVDAEILKLGHHGSSTSSSNEFLDAVDPDYAIISCGEDNKYGHPHNETMDKLNERNIEFHRTDEKGTIVIFTNGTDIIVSGERD